MQVPAGSPMFEARDVRSRLVESGVVPALALDFHALHVAIIARLHCSTSRTMRFESPQQHRRRSPTLAAQYGYCIHLAYIWHPSTPSDRSDSTSRAVTAPRTYAKNSGSRCRCERASLACVASLPDTPYCMTLCLSFRNVGLAEAQDRLAALYRYPASGIDAKRFMSAICLELTDSNSRPPCTDLHRRIATARFIVNA